MLNKFQTIMLMCVCGIMGFMFARQSPQLAQAQEAPYDDGYPYQLVKVKFGNERIGTVSLYAFDRETGELNATGMEPAPSYALTAGAKGGCFVMNEGTGDVWMLNKKGDVVTGYGGIKAATMLVKRQ